MAGVLSSVISAVAWIGGVIGGGVADTGDRRRIIAHCVTTSVVLMAILIIALGVHQVGSWADSTVLGCVVTGCAIAVAASEALAALAVDHHASRALGIAVLATSRSIRHLPALKELG